MEEQNIKNEEAKQAYCKPQFSLKIYYQKQLDKLNVQQPQWQIAECIKNHQTKNHFAHDQETC